MQPIRCASPDTRLFLDLPIRALFARAKRMSLSRFAERRAGVHHDASLERFYRSVSCYVVILFDQLRFRVLCFHLHEFVPTIILLSQSRPNNVGILAHFF